MEVSEIVGVFTALVLFASLFMVVLQLYSHTEQRKLESLTKLYDVNRELIMLGFSHPALFEILMDSKDADPIWERRYLQLWFNQMSLLHAYRERGIFPADLPESLEADIRDFLVHENMRRHWRSFGHYYPGSFRHLVDGILAKIETPVEADESARQPDGGALADSISR